MYVIILSHEGVGAVVGMIILVMHIEREHMYMKHSNLLHTLLFCLLLGISWELLYWKCIFRYCHITNSLISSKKLAHLNVCLMLLLI